MAVIGNIRKHSVLLIVIIGFALAAFVLGDFAKTGPSRTVTIGQVEGEEITIMDFNVKVDQAVEATKQQQQKDRLTPDEVYLAKEDTWKRLVRQILMDKEYDELGLTVTSDELFDLIQGPNPHALIKQYFANPETGQYDRTLILQYLQNLNSMPAANKQQWIDFEKYIREDKLSSKYKTLLTKGYYVPSELAKMTYGEDNNKATILITGKKYQDLSDSLVSPTDADFEAYYAENKELYKQNALRDIEYVVFNIRPSLKDMQNASKEVQAVYKEYQTAEDVIRFANVNSDAALDTTWKVEGQLPVQIDSIMFAEEVGFVARPYLDNVTYSTSRLLDIAYRPDSMKASHILIAYQGAYNANPNTSRTRAEAQQLADSLMNVVQRTSSKMIPMAVRFSDDPSAKQNSGDLGWFADGAMVHPFNEAVLNTNVNKLAVTETPFGFHVIQVTGKKEEVKKVKVAIITHEVIASNETYQDVFAKASKLASENKTKEAFDLAIQEASYTKKTQPNLREMSNYIIGLTNPRQIVRWAFNEETEIGDVSTVFDMEDMFVVACVTRKEDEGYPKWQDVQDRMQDFVENKLKAKIIIEEMAAFGNDVDAVADGMKLEKEEVTPVYFTTRNIRKFGKDDLAMGHIFGMEVGSTTEPIAGNGGVLMVKLVDYTPATDQPTYATTVTKLTTDFQQRVNQDFYYKAIELSADIKDNRIIFY